ncbi:MAG: hypothetical protein J5522_06750 [Lachnospiraceae bacterium]|nr:hypothetical protein [Lachnospiraceae bacterium]
MGAIFIKVLNLSIVAGWLILAIVILRAVFKSVPKWIMCSLWALVGLRLLFPFSLESIFSLVPSAETVPQSIIYSEEPEIHTGFATANTIINPVVKTTFTPEVSSSVNPLKYWTDIIGIVWLVGIGALLLFALASYIRMRKKTAAAVPLSGMNVYECDDIESPFILGLIRPRIYIPSGMDARTFESVYAHETAHLKRKDYIWKPLGFLLLAVYWFNPLMWVAYIMLSRDIEAACDEKVISNMDKFERAAYSKALLACGKRERRISVCPLSFGETGVKGRVRSILNYKKPAFWIILVALIACVVLAVCFLTNPKNEKEDDMGKDISVENKIYGDAEIGSKAYKCTDTTVVNTQTGLSNDQFELRLYSDGTLGYSQPMYSSHLPLGNWYIKDNVLITKENFEGPKYNYFDIEGGNLVYRQEGSSGFLFYQIKDGTVFEEDYNISETKRDYEPAFTLDDKDNDLYIKKWFEARSNGNMVASFHYMGESPSDRISIGLYDDDRCIIDFAKTGYAREGWYNFTQDGLEIEAMNGYLRLVFQPTWSSVDTLNIYNGIKADIMVFEAWLSSPRYEDLGLYDGIRLQYYDLDYAEVRSQFELTGHDLYPSSEVRGKAYQCIDDRLIQGDWSNNLTIELYEDYSINFPQPPYSSYLPNGIWYTANDLVYFGDNVFKIVDEDLVYVSGKGFPYYNVEEGMVFKYKEDLTEISSGNETLDLSFMTIPEGHESLQYPLKPAMSYEDDKEIGGKTYICNVDDYESRLSLGEDSLKIYLFDNGDMTYSQPAFSSYAPFRGRWYIEDDKLVLVDDGLSYFDIVDGNLVYRAGGSVGLRSYTLKDGAVFTRQFDISGY